MSEGQYSRCFDRPRVMLGSMCSQIISQREALERGLRWYFTGKPCKRGHVALRNARWGQCIECDRIRVRPKEQRDNINEAYRKKNKDKIRISSKAYNARHRERILEIKRQKYYENHQIELTRRRMAHHRRRLIKVGGAVSAEQLVDLLKKQKFRCPMCAASLKKVRYEYDHIEPLSRGGLHDIKNIQVLCRPCNRSKNNKTGAEFARLQGLLL
jgi:5-methylcytosine-specific restriction endonuclease McrA